VSRETQVRYEFKDSLSIEEIEHIQLAMMTLASTLESMSSRKLHGVCGISVSRNRGKFGKIKQKYEIEVS
jgi:hypothetical protein